MSDTDAPVAPTDDVVVDLGDPDAHAHQWHTLGADEAGVHELVCPDGHIGSGYVRDIPEASDELRALHAEVVAREAEEAAQAAAAELRTKAEAALLDAQALQQAADEAEARAKGQQP